jgi:hypothetical protein
VKNNIPNLALELVLGRLPTTVVEVRMRAGVGVEATQLLQVWLDPVKYRTRVFEKDEIKV